MDIVVKGYRVTPSFNVKIASVIGCGQQQYSKAEDFSFHTLFHNRLVHFSLCSSPLLSWC